MRFWLVLLLTLSFSLQGWTSVRAADAPCPMETDLAAAMVLVMAASEGAAMPPAASDGDCCNDMATFLASGHACKSGQDCKAPAAAVTLPLDPGASVAVAHLVPAALSPSVPKPVLVAVWRPPTSI
jgi:hypothetical protein